MIQRIIDIFVQLFQKEEDVEQMSDKWIQLNLYNGVK